MYLQLQVYYYKYSMNIPFLAVLLKDSRPSSLVAQLTKNFQSLTKQSH